MTYKHLLLGTAIALVAASNANAAYVSPTGWYMSLGAGANWLQDNNISEPEETSSVSVSWNTGWAVSSAVGYDFGNHWRAEFEVGYKQNDANNVCSSRGDCTHARGTDVWELSQMFNVLYDVNLGGNWEGAVGAGVGGNLVVLNVPGPADGDTNGVKADDYVLAGQLIAQVAYQLSDRWKAYADYKYMFMDDPSMVHPTEPDETITMDKQEHTLMVGLRFDLQRDGAAPMPPKPEQPKAAAPKQFIVFFGFNKSNLTPEAQRVVSEAATAAKETGSASIAVVGHTDTSGSSDYNVKLSVRRSQAVKDALVSLGIAPSGISTSGRGESELMVQTGDGVKEPQNRRATIDLK